jgi:hypothetical protein
MPMKSVFHLRPFDNPMRLPRLTTRRLMALVAVAGAMMGVAQTVQRWYFDQRCAAYHAAKERRSLQRAADPNCGSLLVCGTGFIGVPMLETDPCLKRTQPRDRSDLLADARFHARMRRHYQSRW